MYKFCYTINIDGVDRFCIDTGVSKEKLEKEYGMQLTDLDCYNLIKAKVPEGAIGIREISFEEHNNKDRTYREAWCDVLPDDKINIDMTKAKEIALGRLRESREDYFKALGFGNKLAPEVEEALVSTETKLKLEHLRQVTEPLKELETDKKYDDQQLLDEINMLSDKKVLDDIVKGK